MQIKNLLRKEGWINILKEPNPIQGKSHSYS